MKIIKTVQEMKNLSFTVQSGGRRVALVPTMGALHEGHLSLLKIASQHCDFLVMSVFVNPAQFGPKEDFGKYPRPFERDCELAQAAGCDCVFAPEPSDMYPENYSAYVNVENITETLCGAARPTHFRGVATVVLKLFNIVSPQVAVFGQKDAQQLIVIKRIVQDFNMSVRLIAAPTVRESDGLAMSSRNAYLTKNERDEAAVIYKSLTGAKTLYDSGERGGQVIKNHINSILKTARAIEIEYVEIVDTIRVKPLDTIDHPALVAIACRTNGSNTRLIDNIVLGGDL